ncbi:MAG: hypothetical protein JRN53_00165 [Nitrososphaerota archaeon]|nr:hypothetical protein [Nitrososphaerota archaeon]MDG7035164.1 hypothetical protein [Nitrososphaerota archaeon]MDG7039753.1 hypothetical protein [Nitrososphaerota archaeon]MDG7041534.1 hypothetical protein [Nitrososphaerota archaeon]MDG7045990.1 hypothetical protein [Nitrososphaerota archaeon]
MIDVPGHAELEGLLDELSGLRSRRERCITQLELLSSRDMAVEQREIDELELAISNAVKERSIVVQVLDELAAEEEKLG